MNLNAYDIVKPRFDVGTWVCPSYKFLYSSIIKYRPYCYLLKRYNNQTKRDDYYIAVLDHEIDNAYRSEIIMWRFDKVRIDIKEIWDKTYLKNYIEMSFIPIVLIEQEDDGEVYLLEV